MSTGLSSKRIGRSNEGSASMSGIRVTYKSKVFGPEDFNFPPGENIASPFLADVSAIVTSSPSGIDVDIVSVRTEVGGRELAALLKSEPRYLLKTILRSCFLAEARKGIEGDVVEGEVGT